mmetsp:Transcript_7113/g.18002  ORF Transcript_7113/g.18002 Transcript_7113/m.18002 type:complete len:249 (+) Transcript_7113:425-1171(+)
MSLMPACHRAHQPASPQARQLTSPPARRPTSQPAHKPASQPASQPAVSLYGLGTCDRRPLLLPVNGVAVVGCLRPPETLLLGDHHTKSRQKRCHVILRYKHVGRGRAQQFFQARLPSEVGAEVHAVAVLHVFLEKMLDAAEEGFGQTRVGYNGARETVGNAICARAVPMVGDADKVEHRFVRGVRGVVWRHDSSDKWRAGRPHGKKLLVVELVFNVPKGGVGGKCRVGVVPAHRQEVHGGEHLARLHL